MNKQQELKKRRSLSDFPGYVAARQKLDELKARRIEAVKQRDDAQARLDGLLSGPTKAGLDAEELLAERLLGCRSEADAVAGQGVQELRNTLGELERNLRVLDKAIAMQLQFVDRERGNATQPICQDARPEQAAIVKTILAAVIVLGEANLAERTLLDALEGERVAHSTFLPMMFFPLNGSEMNPLDPSGLVCRWLSEAFDASYIEASDVPKHWREAWEKQAGYRWGCFRPERDLVKTPAASPRDNATPRPESVIYSWPGPAGIAPHS